ncbi:ATP-binding cassette domain-containing protein [Granulicatella sp. zg-ZJ]|uniref:ABC transporter ATP-binding protein n=1 Tax=Granulicatella sp. zg-ZJ TaxID=2678504 RepID=UPI0013D58816|nr:ABC transporter ATP-binding protein [Granulicatella sp. zg-ZJ]NEW62212.1 ATP-binding cassette domain-containing protein [Granulicatella sp. zg-ZJ]
MQVQTDKVNVIYDKTPILHDITLQAKENQFIGLIGPNGSGKSTLLKCIYRTLDVNSGTILLDGTPIHQFNYKETAKKMAVVAQHNQYQFDFTVQDIVLMGRTPYKSMFDKETEEDYRIMEHALTLVDMLAYKDREFSTLSGGEQQRVILARALTQQPSCLILDEPTNHLDIKHQLMLLQTVKKLDMTVIAAIHDLNMAAMYCDIIYVLYQGRIVAVGTPKEVLTKELIKDVYQVNTDIITDKNGHLHILFLDD